MGNNRIASLSEYDGQQDLFISNLLSGKPTLKLDVSSFKNLTTLAYSRSSDQLIFQAEDKKIFVFIEPGPIQELVATDPLGILLQEKAVYFAEDQQKSLAIIVHLEDGKIKQTG